MKRVIVIPEGASDEPIPDLSDQTPLEAADIPVLDELSRTGRLGTAFTVPESMRPTAETSLLSVLGYDPRVTRAGRGALEAIARGIEVGRRDQFFCINVFSNSDGLLGEPLAGFSAPEAARRSLEAMKAATPGEAIELHTFDESHGLLAWRDAGPVGDLDTTPPSDARGESIRRSLPRGSGARTLQKWMRAADGVLAEWAPEHIDANPAVWIWGHGGLPRTARFRERFQAHGVVVSACPLARGVGKLLRLEIRDASVDSTEAGRRMDVLAEHAVRALDEHDLVVVHLAEIDSAGHRGAAAEKAELLSALDRRLVRPIMDRLAREGAWRILVNAGHPTSSRKRRHLADPAIFLLAGTGLEGSRGTAFSERTAAAGELHLEHGHDLMEYFLHR